MVQILDGTGGTPTRTTTSSPLYGKNNELGRYVPVAGQDPKAPLPYVPVAQRQPTAPAPTISPVRPPTVTAAPATTAGQAAIEQARQAALKAQQQLRAQYERDRNELRAQFQFAETEQERQMLARALGTLNEQRDAGLQAIAAGFQHARTQIQGHGAQLAARTPQMAQEMGDIYRTAAGDILGTEDAAAAWGGVPGLAVNVAGTGNSAINDLAAAALAAAPREQALSQRLGDIAGEDIAWLANMMSGESAAHQADLTRLAQAQAGAMQGGHDQRVADRIAQERMLYAQMMGNLQSQYSNRGFQLTDTDIALLGQLGQMQQSAAEAAAQRQLAAQQANASMQHASGLQAQQLQHAASLQQAQLAAAQRQQLADQAFSRQMSQTPQTPSFGDELGAISAFNEFGPMIAPSAQRHGLGQAIEPALQMFQQQQLQNQLGSLGGLFGNLAGTFGSLFRR